MKEAVLAGIAGIPLLLITGTVGVGDPVEAGATADYIVEAGLLVSHAPTLLEQEVAKIQLEAELSKTSERRSWDVQLAYETQLLQNKLAVETVITSLLGRIDRTDYVFGGSTPLGWDCSGMVLWAYKQLSIDLPHSASQQGELGMSVDTPQVGDAVFFNAGAGIYHVAMYLGDELVIHSGFKEGRKTEIISLDNPAFSGNVITYKRFIDLGN
jgi:cell wall-associated NlpC family hydrolase